MSQMKSIVDKLLTNVSSMRQEEGAIAEMIFPKLSVAQYSGLLAKYGNGHLRIETSVVGGEGKYRRVQPITRTSTSYNVESHGLEGMVTKRDYANVEKPYDAEQDEVIGLTSQLLLEKEFTFATALSNTSLITQNVTLSGTSQLSDWSNSDPLSVFSTARIAVKNGCGKRPDTAWLDSRVVEKLRYHPQLLDLLGYKDARPGGLQDSELARVLDVKRVLIADCDYNSAQEGAADSMTAVWGKHIWFGVCPTSAAVRQTSAGYHVGMNGSSPRKVYKYKIDNPPETTGILVEDEYDMLLSNVGAIYLIKSAIA